MRENTKQRGSLLIEVLITLVITIIGLYGMMALASQLQKSEMESYQRTQALILLEDMVNRIETNRTVADDYLTTGLNPAWVGVGMNCNGAPATVAEDDLAQWCDALQGAAESQGGANVGAMLGGRGCVEETIAGSGQYMVTVAWQGLAPVSAPPASVGCGVDQYEAVAQGCEDNLCRRYVSTMVRIAPL